VGDKKRILVADDEDDFRELICLFLKSKKYEVLEACDGGEALSKALSERPDVLILDLMMPVMDGFQVASELTAKMGAEAPKILVVTGRNLVEEDVAILLGGALGIMRKPVKMEDLAANVARILEFKPGDSPLSLIE